MNIVLTFQQKKKNRLEMYFENSLPNGNKKVLLRKIIIQKQIINQMVEILLNSQEK